MLFINVWQREAKEDNFNVIYHVNSCPKRPIRIHSHFNGFDTSLISLNTRGRSLDKHLHESRPTHKDLSVAEMLDVKPCLECKASWMSLRQPIKQILPSTLYLCPYLWKTISAGTSHHRSFTQEMKKGWDRVKQCEPFTSNYDPFHHQFVIPHANDESHA